MRLLHFALVVALAPAVFGCGLDTDGQASPSDDGGDGGPTLDGSIHADADGKVDGNPLLGDATTDGALLDASDGAAADAGNDVAVDACVPTAEVCDDGIDNDCNGHADCDDPACTVGFVCTPPIPQGWTLLEYADTSRPACSTSYATPLDVVEEPAGQPASCACGCAVDPTDPGSCERGTLKAYSNGALGGCTTLTPIDFAANDGACSAKQITSVVGAKAQIAPLPYTPGKCTATSTKTIPALTFLAQGRSCALAAATGGGCATGVCAPKPATPFGVCVVKTGDIPCVGKFTKRHVVSNTVNDTRSCTACSCTDSATCTNTKLTLYEDGSCVTSGGKKSLELAVDDQCDAPNELQATDYQAYVYSADVAGLQCNASTSSPTGGVALTAARTICCQ